MDFNSFYRMGHIAVGRKGGPLMAVHRSSIAYPTHPMTMERWKTKGRNPIIGFCRRAVIGGGGGGGKRYTMGKVHLGKHWRNLGVNFETGRMYTLR
jgi:hypothetical protein